MNNLYRDCSSMHIRIAFLVLTGLMLLAQLDKDNMRRDADQRGTIACPRTDRLAENVLELMNQEVEQ